MGDKKSKRANIGIDGFGIEYLDDVRDEMEGTVRNGKGSALNEDETMRRRTDFG
jgi:hypothetical protein